MTQSSENKWMFEAKRLDNGEEVTGRLGYCMANPGDWVIDCITTTDLCDIPIDQSTIKPLFKTEPDRDEWIFENKERRAYRDLSDGVRKLIHDQIMVDVSKVEYFEQEDLEWMDILDNYESVFFGAIYRVKSPQYTIDKLFSNLEELTGCDLTSLEKEEINKFAKANGLDGNNE